MNTIKDDAPNHGGVEVVASWTVSAWDCMNVARWFGRGVPLGHISSTIRDLMLAGFCCLFFVGCGSSEVVSPEVAKRAEELSAPFAKELATTLAAQKLTGEMTLENTQAILTAVDTQTKAITTLTKTLEASLVKSEPQNGKDGDPASALESPPAKNAKDSHPTKEIVAEPVGARLASDGTVLRWNIEGNWNPTILETSAHLRTHGINTDGMTHQQMADIHADLHEGKTLGGQPVTGGIFQNNRASAITSERTSVRSLPQRVSFFGRAKYSTRQSCPSGRCPQR